MTTMNADTGATPLKKGRRVSAPVLTGLLVVLGGIAAWDISTLPFFQENRLSHMSLDALKKEQETHNSHSPLLLYYIGRRLNEQGRFAEADGYLREAVGGEPGVARYRDAWARALLGSGRTTAAFGELREFAGTHPESADAHLLLGKFYVTQNSYRRAIEELTAATRLKPDLAEAWAFLAAAHYSLNEVHPAREAAETAARLRPKNASDQLMLATMRASDNDRDGARTAFEMTLKLDPHAPVVQRTYANFLLRGDAGDLARAVTLAQNAVTADANDFAAHYVLGLALLALGKPAEALPALQTAAEHMPTESAPALAVVQALNRLGRTAEAGAYMKVHQEREARSAEKEKLRSQLELNPQNAAAHQRFAHLLAEEGDVNGCVRHHADAIHKPVDSPLALAAAAQDLISVGRASDALPLAQRAYDTTQSSPAAVETLGDTLLALKRPDDAIKYYHTLIAWDSRRYPYFRAKMDRYYAAEEKEAAANPAEQFYQRSREAMRGQVRVVRVPEQALRLAAEAVKLAPDNPTYLRHLMLLQSQTKLPGPKLAIETARRLLKVAPDDLKAEALLGALLADQATDPKDLTEAEEHLKRAGVRPELAATCHYGQGLVALKRNQPAQAVTELREAARLDPRPAVTYFKLARAEALAGNAAESAKAKAEYDKRHQESEAEGQALYLLGQHLGDPRAYEKAAAVFESFGRKDDAAAIRAAKPTDSRPVPPPIPALSRDRGGVRGGGLGESGGVKAATLAAPQTNKK